MIQLLLLTVFYISATATHIKAVDPLAAPDIVYSKSDTQFLAIPRRKGKDGSETWISGIYSTQKNKGTGEALLFLRPSLLTTEINPTRLSIFAQFNKDKAY